MRNGFYWDTAEDTWILMSKFSGQGERFCPGFGETVFFPNLSFSLHIAGLKRIKRHLAF
jgi:hypothetical protein